MPSASRSVQPDAQLPGQARCVRQPLPKRRPALKRAENETSCREKSRVMKACFFRLNLPAILLGAVVLSPGQIGLAQTAEPPLVTIIASDHHAAEAEQVVGIFTVSRTGATEASLNVFYELSGSARNGVDYQELPRSLTIPAGATSA